MLAASILLIKINEHPTWGKYIACTIILAIMPLLRDSALICLLALSAIMWFSPLPSPSRFSFLSRWLFIFGPILTYILATAFINVSVKHERRHVSSEFMFLDVVGCIKLDEDIAKSAPYISSSFSPEWKEGHRYGSMMRITTHVIRDYAPGDVVARQVLSEHKLIRRDWINVAKQHPLTMAKVKLITFAQFFNPRLDIGGWGWMRPIIAPWRLKLEANPVYFKERQALVTRGWDDKSTPSLLSQLQGGILVWFILGLFSLAWCVKNKDRTWILFILPISYVLSYGIVTVNVWHKYMYPSTLILQVVILSIMSRRLMQGLK